jgi:hypothetical protein
MIFTGIYNIIVLSISAVLLSRLSKGLEVVELTGYKKEKEWNKRQSLILGMMFVAWLTEILAWDREYFNHLQPWIISDVIKLFTAFNLFVIFVLRKHVTVFMTEKFNWTND